MSSFSTLDFFFFGCCQRQVGGCLWVSRKDLSLFWLGVAAPQSEFKATPEESSLQRASSRPAGPALAPVSAKTLSCICSTSPICVIHTVAQLRSALRHPPLAGKLRLKQILDSGVRRTGFPELSPPLQPIKLAPLTPSLSPLLSLQTPTTRGEQCFTNGKFRSVSVKVRPCLPASVLWLGMR